MDIKIRKCTLKDLNKIIAIGEETYCDTFNQYCRNDVMEAYLREAFDGERINAELKNKNSQFYFAVLETNIVGYIKTNILDTQTDLQEETGMEIERLYVIGAYQRKGIGTKLIKCAIEHAKELNKTYIWLGVWKRNRDAILFYTRQGFIKSGTHSFRMGKEKQVDYIMKKYI